MSPCAAPRRSRARSRQAANTHVRLVRLRAATALPGERKKRVFKCVVWNRPLHATSTADSPT
jgi:hypothetical protein